MSGGSSRRYPPELRERTAAGRWAKKGANHFDVRLADQALALGGGGGGQLRGQRFASERPTLP